MAEHERFLSNTKRVSAQLSDVGISHGTVHGDADSNDLVEVHFDVLTTPVWMRDNELQHLGYEASIEVQHDGFGSPEESALSLLQWITSQDGPFYVTVKGSDNASYNVRVEYDDAGVPSARLADAVLSRKSGVGQRPGWLQSVVTAAEPEKGES